MGTTDTVEKAYRYTYNGSSLTQMEIATSANGGTATTEKLYFAYDASGSPMSVTYNNATYYYATNVQGDVTAILNTSGTAVVQYTYDAWGNILTTTGSMASTLGAHNPLRYRGYVYDTETTLYYLQSRYYNPEMGRFINGDAFTSTGQGLLGNNMFVYCANNPVRHVDSEGYFFFTVPGAATGFVSSAITAMVTCQDKETWFETACHGAIGGALAGAGVDAALLILGSAGTAAPAVAMAVTAAYTLGGLGNVYSTYATSNGKAIGDELLGSFIIGGTFNTLSLATGLGATSNTVEGLFIRGMADLGENTAVGVGIGVSTSIATSIGTQDSPFAVKRDFKRRAVL